MVIINRLKSLYKEHSELRHLTFKQFFVKTLGIKLYKQFIVTTGYTDYENADVYETLYNYGMDDNKGGWIGFYVPWKQLVNTLYDKIGSKHFKFNQTITQVQKVESCLFEITSEDGHIYHSNKLIIASTIDTIRKLLPSFDLYKQIHGQPFLRLYGKFTKKSAEIMKQYVPHHTIVPGPLQKIISIDADKGVYMIAYSDNASAQYLRFGLSTVEKNHLDNTGENREFFCQLLEQSLGIPKDSLQLIAIKDFYWTIGTHYYDPLRSFLNEGVKSPNKSRDLFLQKVQHPDKGILIVGEAVSRSQGWVEGALESVETGLHILMSNFQKISY